MQVFFFEKINSENRNKSTETISPIMFTPLHVKEIYQKFEDILTFLSVQESFWNI